jgi:hypothetical protein
VKLEIGHFKIIGCPVYIHVPEEEDEVGSPSGKKGIFVGYNETSKAYMIFIPMQRKTIVRRDVKFEENLASRKSHELPPVVEDEEQEAPKGEQRLEASSSGNQPSGGEELAPSSSIRRPRWFEQTLKDV